jgi:hypothetical protein
VKEKYCMMWIQRLICLFRGHQLLSMAAVYSQKLAGGNGLDLHYCARCGSAVWTAPPGGAAVPSKWSDTGQA